MPKPKRHHTIPRVYLEDFVEEDQRLTVWSKRRRNYQRPKTTEALIRGHYYSQPVDGQLNADQSIEAKLLNDLETRYPSFIDQLHSGKPNIDIELFVQTVVSLRARSAAFREPFELGLADYVERATKNIPKGEMPVPPAGLEDIWDSIKVSIDPHRSLHAMAHYVRKYALVLSVLEYSVRVAPNGARLFTSDNPVVWYERGYGSTSPIVYPQSISKDTRAVIPISDHEALVGVPSKTGDFKYNPHRMELSRQQVREINELQLACAWDEVVGTAILPKISWDRFGGLAPRMDISNYYPNTGEFWIDRTYLDVLRSKQKFG